jgi:hypothetical protein
MSGGGAIGLCPPGHQVSGALSKRTYRIEAWVGGGGFGEVYRAVSGGATYAIKIFTHNKCSEARELWEEERTKFDAVAKAPPCRHVVSMEEAFEVAGAGGAWCIVLTPYATGGTLW